MIEGKRLPATLRRKKILTALDREGHVSIVDVAEQLGVSDMTVRRDLEMLAEENLVVRTHGGAHRPEIFQERPLATTEPSPARRAHINPEEKRRIAHAALELIEPHTTIAIDIGTTAYELATLIDDPTVQILSSSLPILRNLAERKMTTFVPCGQLSGFEPSISGAQTIAYLQNFHFDIAFLGVAGLTLDGTFDYSFEETEVKKLLIHRSSKSVLLADRSKFGAMSTVRVAGYDKIDLLITDAEPPAQLRARMEAAGMQIVVAQ